MTTVQFAQGPQAFFDYPVARANLGGPVNLRVGNTGFLFFYVHARPYTIYCGKIMQRGERIYTAQRLVKSN